MLKVFYLKIKKNNLSYLITVFEYFVQLKLKSVELALAMTAGLTRRSKGIGIDTRIEYTLFCVVTS